MQMRASRMFQMRRKSTKKSRTACQGGSARRRSLGNATGSAVRNATPLSAVTRTIAAIHVFITRMVDRSVPTIRIKPARIDVNVPISMKPLMRGSVQWVSAAAAGSMA